MAPIHVATLARLQAIVEGYNVRKDRTTTLRRLPEGGQIRQDDTARTTTSKLYAALQAALDLVRTLDRSLTMIQTDPDALRALLDDLDTPVGHDGHAHVYTGPPHYDHHAYPLDHVIELLRKAGEPTIVEPPGNVTRFDLDDPDA